MALVGGPRRIKCAPLHRPPRSKTPRSRLTPYRSKTYRRSVRPGQSSRSDMEDDTALLWPYSPKVAVLAAPVIWIGLLAVLAFVVGYLGWSEAGSRYVLVGVLIA